MDRNWSAMLYLVINFLSAKTKTIFGGGCWSSMEIFCAFISFIRSTIVWTKHKQWPVASEWEVLGASANTKQASTNGMRVQILRGSSSSSSWNLQVHVIRDYMSFILSPFQPRATNRTKEAYDHHSCPQLSIWMKWRAFFTLPVYQQTSTYMLFCFSDSS